MNSESRILVMSDDIKNKIGSMLGVDLSMNKKMSLVLNDGEALRIVVEEGYFCELPTKKPEGPPNEIIKPSLVDAIWPRS